MTLPPCLYRDLCLCLPAGEQVTAPIFRCPYVWTKGIPAIWCQSTGSGKAMVRP